VYSTTQTPIELTAKYDGILFFSPSAVDSFFSINHVDEITYLFAIGLTTAKTIQQYNKNNIIISPTPSKENIVKQIITHFNTIKNDQTVL
jgi:uroporphyrinogen-III synthase